MVGFFVCLGLENSLNFPSARDSGTHGSTGMQERIELLEARVETLERELKAIRQAVSQPDALKDPGQMPGFPPAATPEDASEEILQWVGQSALLPRISTICFLLVVALILRTLTDNGMVDKQVGSLLGMTYAALLISIGWYKYRRLSPLAPVFGVCGAILMYSIVVETHAHFESLPSVPAYMLLVATGVGMGLISYFHHSALPVLVGSLGMGLASLAVDYPNPYYPHLGVVLLIANLLGAFATRLQKCSWLRWILLLVTVTMLQVWGIKIKIKWAKGGPDLAALGPDWYLPMIAIFLLVFLGTAVWAVLRWSERVSRFDLSLPPITVVCAYAAAGLVTRQRWGTNLWLACMAIVFVFVLLGWAAWLADRQSGKGANAFALAGTLLAILSLPTVFGSLAWALPVISGFAICLGVAAEKWNRGGLRLLSYLTQLYAGAALVYLLRESGAGPSFLTEFSVSGLLAGASLFHFWWCRRHSPAGLDLFSRLDPEDRSAIFLFLSGLSGGFLLVRAVLYQILSSFGGEFQIIFQGGQSVIINAAAAILMLVAFRGRDREMRNVSILITLIGAGKVFIYDLFALSGLPLVLSVFSFGLTVSLISICLPRWTRVEESETGVGGAGGSIEGTES